MAIERLVYECSKIGIEKDYSGGQIYSYTKGMKKLLENAELNIGKLMDYENPIDYVSDTELDSQSLAPMSYTYEQMETLFPKQFRYQIYGIGNKKIFAFSNNRVSLDWGIFEDYNAYLNSTKDRKNIVGGRSGAHEFYILTGEQEYLKEYPCMYYQSQDFRVPFSPEDLCSLKKPDYMSALSSISLGNIITEEIVREYILEDRERSNKLKEMLYCLLRYNKTEERNYEKNLIVCDEHEDIIYWISALSFLFSKDMARTLTFSTYEYSPVGSGYRICGAFPRGTDYDAGASYKECYVFDFWNDKFENTDIESDSELYGFLVSSFLYNPVNLDKFYSFLAKYEFMDISAELENAFELYNFFYLDKDNQKVSMAQVKMAADFAKYCFVEEETERILLSFVNFYLQRENNQEFEETIVNLLRHFPEKLNFVCQRCTNTLIGNFSKYSLDAVKTVYGKFDTLLAGAGADLFSEFYSELSSRADELIANNSDIQYNMYFAELIFKNIKKSGGSISNITPVCTEGNMLRLIVGNILAQNFSENKLKQYILELTRPYQQQSYEYLCFLMTLEGMARDYTGNSVQNWIAVSEDCIKSYIESHHGQTIYEVYQALIDLQCEDKVLKSIKNRSCSNEEFDLLFEDVKNLLLKYEREFRNSESSILNMLLEAAEGKGNVRNNLSRLFELRKDRHNDKFFLNTAEKIVANMGILSNSIDATLLNNIINLYNQNHIKPDEKMMVVLVLQGLQTDIQKGKRYIKSQYEKANLRVNETYNFPGVSEREESQYFQEFASCVTEIYLTIGRIEVIDYYNELFNLNINQRRYLIDVELQLLAREGGKSGLKLLSELIVYSFVSGLQPGYERMSDILCKERMNINKLNKYINENNKDILAGLDRIFQIEANIKNIRKELLAYCNDVYDEANKKSNGFMKNMIKFLKK